MTFNNIDGLQLRSTWKDSFSVLQEELKNISYENRTLTSSFNNNIKAFKDETFIESIAEQFEEFIEKFESSYFNCTHRTGGHFILKESEGIFMFCLSNEKAKLEELSLKLKIGWQRKNIFIQLHPDSYKEFCESNSSNSSNSSVSLSTNLNFNYFPVTNLRDSDQLARTLCHANIFNSFETPNMEILGKGGLVNFVLPSLDGINIFGKCMGLMRPNLQGKPKWPIPNTLTESSWSESMPRLIVNISSEELQGIHKIEFDEYITFAPIIHQKLCDSLHKGPFIISTECELGIIPCGYCEIVGVEMINSNSSSSNEEFKPVNRLFPSLIKVFIGPFNFPKLIRVIDGKEPFSKYLQNIPQFYEYFLHNNLGETKWNDLCRQNPKSWRNEFPLPSGLVENKNRFRTSYRQKAKNDLILMVERAESSHRLRLNNRQNSLHYFVFPSLNQLQNDASHFNRLNSRFKNSLQIFLASCDPKLGCSTEFSQFQLPQVLFKHSLPVSQMTDFSETMKKKRSLKSLFNENERDLFHILKEMPILQEEMAATNFVSGDIFGNPYKKEKKSRKSKINRNISTSMTSTSCELNEIEEEKGEQIAEIISPISISIDEIDYKEMEDVETEILVNGSIINVPFNNDTNNNHITDFDILSVKNLIRSPGGIESKTKLIEILPIISSCKDLEILLDLSKRFKRVGLSILINERINKLSQS